MNIAFYGRINAGKDTAAMLTFIALTYWKSGVTIKKALNQDHSDLHSVLKIFGDGFDHMHFHRTVTKGKKEPFEDVKFMSFSTKIHEMTALLTDTPLNKCLDRKFKETFIPGGFNKTIRQIMIDIGEGLRRSYGSDVWVAPVLNFIADNPRNLILIPGMRHQSEFEALKSINYTVLVKVQSDFEVVKGSEFAEGLLDNYEFDFVLSNKHGDLQVLWIQVLNMVYSLGEEIKKHYAN